MGLIQDWFIPPQTQSNQAHPTTTPKAKSLALQSFELRNPSVRPSTLGSRSGISSTLDVVICNDWGLVW